jgi:hypothetical protein
MRIQLDLPEEKVAEIKALMASSKIETYKDLFNNALTVFEWAISEKRNRRFIASVDPDEKRYRELVMPALESAASEAPVHVAAMAQNGNSARAHAGGKKR